MYNYDSKTLGMLALSYAEGTAEAKNDLLKKFSPDKIYRLEFADFNSPLTNSVKLIVENIAFLLEELAKKQIKVLSMFFNELG